MYKKTRFGLTWMSNVVAVHAHLGEEQKKKFKILIPDCTSYSTKTRHTIHPETIREAGNTEGEWTHQDLFITR